MAIGLCLHSPIVALSTMCDTTCLTGKLWGFYSVLPLYSWRAGKALIFSVKLNGLTGARGNWTLFTFYNEPAFSFDGDEWCSLSILWSFELALID